ncbi:hypothetical protein [Caenibius sp. WL]|uniref:hypothetical protein n=1 Tax=Caenibius sp. WL TaxID=2872646 RepID=UPI001C9A0A09|nr:hypothetical protein [Caenibius sp. WL]QZP07759.1 hypothetical protein K5X80_14065 [Caenibius sp. WL]QZP09955.1 hypothetical protein K5X80_16865 [Caenibius sp. WL]
MNRRPTLRQMNILAINVLIDAARRAKWGPIERTDAHRLALAWLVHNRIATSEVADGLWTTLGSEVSDRGAHTQYCRDRALQCPISSWQSKAMLPDDWYWINDKPPAD